MLCVRVDGWRDGGTDRDLLVSGRQQGLEEGNGDGDMGTGRRGMQWDGAVTKAVVAHTKLKQGPWVLQSYQSHSLTGALGRAPHGAGGDSWRADGGCWGLSGELHAGHGCLCSEHQHCLSISLLLLASCSWQRRVSVSKQ